MYQGSISFQRIKLILRVVRIKVVAAGVKAKKASSSDSRVLHCQSACFLDEVSEKAKGAELGEKRKGRNHMKCKRKKGELN